MCILCIFYNIPHAKFIVDEIVKTLYDDGIIEKTTSKAVEDIIFSGTTTRMTHVLQRLKSSENKESQLKIGEESLDKWLIRIENEVMKKFDGLEQEAVLYSVRELFNSIYSLFGFTYKSPFYREARLMLLRVGETLKLSGLGSFKLNNFEDLESFIGRDLRYIYDNRKTSPDSIPEIKTITNLRKDIEISLSSSTSLSINEIERILTQIDLDIQTYINCIQDHINGDDILDGIEDSPMKILLNEIIHSPFSNILEKVENRIELSHLLFGDGKDVINDFVEYKEKYLRSLLEIKFNVDQWTLETFKDISILTTSSELEDLKVWIQETIDRWIFNNPYQDFINEKPIRFHVIHTKEFLQREFDVVYNVYKAFRLQDKLSFRKISKDSDSSFSLTRALKGKSSAFNIGPKTLRKYLIKIEQFKSQTIATPYAISVYQEAIDTIKDYVADRHLGFSIKKSARTGYNPIFHQDWYKATLIILNLAKFGGIQPLTFGLLSPELFDKDPNTGLFQPHHLDASNT